MILVADCTLDFDILLGSEPSLDPNLDSSPDWVTLFGQVVSASQPFSIQISLFTGEKMIECRQHWRKFMNNHDRKLLFSALAISFNYSEIVSNPSL